MFTKSVIAICSSLILLQQQAFGQDLVATATELQNKYKEEEVALLDGQINYIFSKDINRSMVKVGEKKDLQLLSLRYNQTLAQYITYDANSTVEKFYGSSNLRQVLPDNLKYCGNYTSDGYFYDDSKFCSQVLKLKEVGELWKLNSVKTVNDSKYQTSVYFQENYPVVNKTVKFTIPKDIDIQLMEFNLDGYSISKAETEENNNRVVTYTIKDLPPFETFRNKQGSQYYSPHILILVKSYMASANKKVTLLESVDDLYKWYHSLASQLKTNEAVIKATADKIIAGKQTDEEKIKAIFYWVQDNIRYIAFEDGVAGFKPDDAQNVLEKKYGDCKGMANLTKEILRAAGYDARLTWIGTKSIRYDYTIPSLAVDNHMICTVFLNGKRYFLDATEDYDAFGDYAERIQGRPVMIEDGEKYILDKVPELDKTRNLEEHQYTAKINGDLFEGTGKFTLNGEVKKDFLYFYNHTKNDEKKDYLDHFINNERNTFKVTNIKYDDLNERSGAFNINFNFSIANTVNTFNNEMYIEIDPSKDLKNASVTENRMSNLDFGEKIYKKMNIDLEVPSGYTVSQLPEDLEIKEKDFSFKFHYSMNGNKISYSKELCVDKGIIEKADFAKWNNAIKKLSKAYENQIILKKQ